MNSQATTGADACYVTLSPDGSHLLAANYSGGSICLFPILPDHSLGGASFAGGQGGMIESFIGLFVLQLLSNCMSALQIDGFWQKLIEGVIIVAIIAGDCYSRKRKRERV